MKRRRAILAPAALALACAGLLGWAALRADAAWQFFAAETITKNMYQDEAFTPASIDAAQRHLDRALARFSQRPDYLHLAGGLAELRARQPGTVGQERRELLDFAAESYRASLRTRPLWPYGWVKLLSVKDKLDQVDAEFNTAMRKAAETGPWEPRVQLQLLRTGLRHWEQLRRPEREIVRETLDHALQVQPREAFEVVQFYVRPDLVCGRDSGHAQIERWCRNVAPA